VTVHWEKITNETPQDKHKLEKGCALKGAKEKGLLKKEKKLSTEKIEKKTGVKRKEGKKSGQSGRK